MFYLHKKEFDHIFEVYDESDKYIFLYCDISKKDEMLNEYFDYFFNEEVMFNHFNYLHNMSFIPNKENYIKLYRELKKFLDEKNIIKLPFLQEDEEIINILFEENVITTDEKSFEYNFDKSGKIGEYFFSILLERFFNLKCVIPKAKYITNNNMSVHGIDVIYLREDDNLLYFGESKFTKNLYNGITQINKSLSSYEKMISDEYELILTDMHAHMNIYKLYEIYGDYLSCSISFKSFIDKANIKEVCIPLFIAHGNEINAKDILKELDKITKISVFNLETKYLIISLPIVDKDEFMRVISYKIAKRMLKYGE